MIFELVFAILYLIAGIVSIALMLIYSDDTPLILLLFTGVYSITSALDCFFTYYSYTHPIRKKGKR